MINPILDPTEYGNEEVDRLTVEKLFDSVELSEVDRECLYLRFSENWTYPEIADYVGSKYLGRTDLNTLWEGTIRHRVNKALSLLRSYLKHQHKLRKEVQE